MTGAGDCGARWTARCGVRCGVRGGARTERVGGAEMNEVLAIESESESMSVAVLAECGRYGGRDEWLTRRGVGMAEGRSGLADMLSMCAFVVKCWSLFSEFTSYTNTSISSVSSVFGLLARVFLPWSR